MPDINPAEFSISATGDIRHVSGTQVYTVLELHKWLQDLADNETFSGNDNLDILSPNPSKLDGPRDAVVASRLNLLAAGSISFNIDDDAAQYINFGSIKQNGATVQYSGLQTIGGIVANSPMYVVQNNAKLTKFWSDGHIRILIKVKTANTLIDSGNVTAFSRKWGQTYSHFDTNLAAGGESAAALSTALDSAIVLTEAQAAALSSKVTITVGDTTQDLGNGSGPKLYKGTIALSSSCTLQEAYQYLQYITRENSTNTINSIPGWRYRKLNSAYSEVTSAPFGTFAGGTFFVAQGWYLTGVLPAESTKYQLIAHDGTTQSPPILATIDIGNLVSGDRVLVTKADVSGNIIKDQFTPVAASSGATALTIVENIPSDTPTSGVIRIKNKRYTYTSYTTATKTFNGLSPALLENIVTADDVFVPYIDAETTTTNLASSFTFNTTFSARVDVRNGSGVSPIIPFATTVTVSSTGASVNASRNSDV
jgi:hypothetical protein